MPPKVSSLEGFQLIETGIEHFQYTVPQVLRHFDSQTVASVLEAIAESVEAHGLRFSAAQAFHSPIPLAEWTVADSSSQSAAKLFAAAYIMEYPGRLASLVGPWVSNDLLAKQYPSAAEAVLQSLVCIARRWGVELLQAVLEIDSPFSREILDRAGFVKLAALHQMTLDLETSEVCLSGSLSKQDGASSSEIDRTQSIVWRRYEPSDYTHWIDWMDATYVGTTDCPELNGIRTTAETFSGYLATSGVKPGGLERPAWWGAFPSPCATLRTSESPSTMVSAFMLSQTGFGLWELSYMGVVPEFRGRGLGDETLRQAIIEARKLDAKQLWLAVDHRNHSALRLYNRFGFEPSRRLEAWFHALKP